jgi:hypothetical protein
VTWQRAMVMIKWHRYATQATDTID